MSRVSWSEACFSRVTEGTCTVLGLCPARPTTFSFEDTVTTSAFYGMYKYPTVTVLKVNVNGVNLNYEVAGSGKPIVFLHGLGTDLSIWNKQADALSDQMKVIRYDVRGLGSSDRITSVSVGLWADDLYGIIKALKLSEVIVAGHSMSGMTVIKFAVEHPEITKAVIVVNGTDDFSPEARKAIEERAVIVRRDGMMAVADKVINAGFHADFLAKNRESSVAQYRSILLKNDPESYAASCEAIVKSNLSDEASRVVAPTLILVGETDIMTPVSDAEKLNKSIPNSLMKIIPKAGHITPIEQPDIVTNTIRTFVKTLE